MFTLHCTHTGVQKTRDCSHRRVKHTGECNTSDYINLSGLQFIWLKHSFMQRKGSKGGVELIGDVYCSVCVTISLITYRRDSY